MTPGEEFMAFWRLYYHLVWATKNRERIITPAVEARLYPYLVSKAAELDVYVYAINGWHDHIHLVVAIPPKHAVAEIVKRLKGASSHYLNYDVRLDRQVAWQRGYGARSVGERQRTIAEAYVKNQKQHHEQQTTNAWLEQIDEFDAGPTEVGISFERSPNTLRETRTAYQCSTEPLF
jgi:putative transposase